MACSVVTVSVDRRERRRGEERRGQSSTMRRLLFVCERNTVLGPAASAIFHHMGVR